MLVKQQITKCVDKECCLIWRLNLNNKIKLWNEGYPQQLGCIVSQDGPCPSQIRVLPT